MTKTNVILSLLSILIVVSLCFYLFRVVKGSGKVVEENRKVKAFNTISIEGIGKVIYSKGETQKVSVVTDDNIMEYIKTETKGGTLKVSCAKHAAIKPSKLEIRVTSPSLDGFSGKGAISFLSDDAIVTKGFSLALIGKATADVDLTAESLKTSLTGKGRISLTGDINQHTISMTGEGRIKGLDLQSKLTSVSATGKGFADLNVTDTLSLDMKGKITIQYKGTPEVQKKSVGKNSVTRITS